MKQKRYQDKSGNDLIDHWAATRSREVFRAIMYAMVEKYNTRLGKKDDILAEVTKMADYINRWKEYEAIWVANDVSSKKEVEMLANHYAAININALGSW